MAIDSAEKRKNASGIQVTLIAGVTPNSSKDQEWRQQSGWGYGGILAGATVPSTTVLNYGFFEDDPCLEITDINDTKAVLGI